MMASDRETTRRRFFGHCGLAAGAVLLGGHGAGRAGAATAQKLHVASNQFTWMTYFRREKRNFLASLDEGLDEVVQAGLNGLEPFLGDPKQIDRMGALLKQHGLEMRSAYCGVVLYAQDRVDAAIDKAMGLARSAKKVGTRILVVNPADAPSRREKTDEELGVQARAMNRLGRELAAIGMTLSYHHHATPMKNHAREFHHLMGETDPKLVTYCLDAHWVFRGSGNSTQAVSEMVKRYGARTSELHLRQSIDGVWSETFGDGDIDYRAMAAHFLEIGVKPHLVLEQAVERGTPNTLSAVEANRRSCEYIRQVFAGFAN